MKKFLVIAGILVLVAAVGLGFALTKLDTAQISKAAAEQASSALDRKVDVGAVHISVFPFGVRVNDVRVAGDPGAPQLASVDAIELGVALWPLLRRTVKVTSLKLDKPRIALPVGRDGMPVVPDFSKGEDKGKPADKPPRESSDKSAKPPAGAESEPINVSIERFSIAGGELTSGPWKVRNLTVSGSLPSLSSVRAKVSAVLEGLAQIEDGNVEVQGIGGNTTRTSVAATLRDVNLPGVLAALPEKPKDLAITAGRASGPLSAEIAGSTVKAARADLSIDGLDARSGTNEIKGTAKAQVTLGDRYSIDLTGASITVPGTLQKPAGGKLSLSGALGAEPSAAALRNGVLALGNAEIPLTFQLGSEPQRVEIGRTDLDLAALAQWLQDAPGKIGGHVRSEGLRVTLSPLRLDGALQLDGASLAMDKQAPVSVTGAVQAQGTRLSGQELAVVVGEQKVLVSGGYDLEPGTFDVSTKAEKLDVEKLVSTLRGSSPMTGILNGQLNFKGKPALDALGGNGEISIKPGRILGFSLMKQFLGQFAEVATVLAQSRGVDLKKFEEEEFELLGGRFTMVPGRVNLESLRLDYRYGSAEMTGTVGLPAGELDLRGKLMIRREVGEAISGGSQQVREESVPLGIGCVIAKPCVKIDRPALVSLAARYAAKGQLGEKLEEKLGKENADRIKGVLDGILGGGGRKPDAAPAEGTNPDDPPNDDSREGRRGRRRDRERNRDRQSPAEPESPQPPAGTTEP